METIIPPPPVQLPPQNQEPSHQESVNATSKINISDKNADAHKPRTSFAFNNFKNLVKNVASSCGQTSLLENYLDGLLPHFLTPDHPPYAAMIQEAIEKLNEEEGSGKEIISTFMKENYNDLPWAHDGMLEHHLNLLCKSGYLVQTKDGRYLIANGAIEKSDGPSCSLESTADTSPSVGTSYSSFSSSSSSSSLESDYSSDILRKKKLRRKKQRKARTRKKNVKLGKSVEGNGNFARRTKSSIIALGRSSKKDKFLVTSEVEAATKHSLMLQEEEEKELNEVSSDKYRNTEQPGDGSEDSDSEFQEQDNQKKRARKRCGKVNGKRNKTAKKETLVAWRGRGRSSKKVVLEVSDEENCLMTGDKPGVGDHETKSIEDQNVDIEKVKEATGGESKITELDNTEKINGEGDISRPYNTEEVVKLLEQQNIIRDGSPDEVLEKQNNHVENQTNLLYLLQDSASGEFLPDQEDKKEEANNHIEVATTKKRVRNRKCKQGVNGTEITPIQTPVAGRGSGKQRGRPRRKQLAFEETKPIPEEIVVNNETTGKVHQAQEAEESNMQIIPFEVQIATHEQNLPDEVPKRRRGRPPKTEKKVQPKKPPRKNDNASRKQSKLQDPNEEGEEPKPKKKRVRKEDTHEEGKELKKKRVRKPRGVPGRKRGRPRKNDISSQLEMIQEQLKTIGLQDMEGKAMEEQNGSKKTIGDK